MIHVLSAHFFDGISSFPKPVNVSFSGHELLFEFVDSTGQSIHLRWSAGEIAHEKHSHGRLRKITHQSNELVFLEIQDQDFSSLDNWLDLHSVNNQKFALFMNRGLILGILLAALSFFPLFYFFGIPLITDHAAQHVPIEIEQKMGREMAKSILASYTEDKIKSAYADSLVGCFKDKLRIPVKIHVVQSEELNAFALPGGQIFVYSAMLDTCKTKEELMALLGHEIGHVQLRHTTKSVLQSVIGSVLFSLIISDYNGMAGVATEQAAQLKNLSYSRELESEADEYSIHLLANSQLNPNGLISLFGIFQEEEKANQLAIPVFLSSHPLTKDRIADAKKEIKRLSFETAAQDKMDFYFKHLSR